MTVSDWIGVYAAVVATIVGILQYRTAVQTAKFLHVDETFWIGDRNGLDEQDLEDVLVDSDDEPLSIEDGVQQFSFYVSNRGSQPVTIRDAAIYEHSHKLFGLRQREEWAFVLSNDDRNPPGKFKLAPGEGRVLYARVEDLRESLGVRHQVSGKRRSTRYLKLAHSQSSQEFVHKFDINRR